MACYLYTVRVKASLLYLHVTAIMLARAVLFPYSLLYLQTTICFPGCLKVINCAALMLIHCIYTMIQLYNVEVAMLFRSPLLQKPNLFIKYTLMQDQPL